MNSRELSANPSEALSTSPSSAETTPSPLASTLATSDCISIEQALLEVGHGRFERSQPLVNVEKYFVGETAGDESLAKLSLRVVIRIELVRVTRTRRLQHAFVVRVVAIAHRIVLHPDGPEPGMIDCSAPI